MHLYCMENTLEVSAQNIIDSYKWFPGAPMVDTSLVEEISTLIVDHIFLTGQAFEDFDFEDFLGTLNFKGIENA